ncbi:MAG TPA: divalent-cation tolerance protein CutA [Chloroflexia bacterium]|nr:divalent-cation tolerance protein CutA [Chloroflexia bacterium]
MHEQDRVVLLYVPCGSEEEAALIGTALIEERLIACANILESRSLYRWKDAIADEREKVLLCKTIASRAEVAQRRVVEMHSYEVPCVLRLEPASVSHDYAKWIFGEVFGVTPT